MKLTFPPTFYALKCPSTKLCTNKMPSVHTKMPAHLCTKFFAPQCTSSISLTYFPLYILLPILLTYTPGESVYLNSSELCKNVWNMLISIQCSCTKVNSVYKNDHFQTEMPSNYQKCLKQKNYIQSVKMYVSTQKCLEYTHVFLFTLKNDNQ